MADPLAVLILDIDGNINPFYARATLEDNPERLPGFREHSIQDESYGDARVFLQTEELRASLLRLRELGVELIWGSAWNESSNLILRMLFPEGMANWPTIIFPDEVPFSFEIQTWKLETVRSFIEENYHSSVPLIWLDDEVFADAQSWLESRTVPSLLIRPERHRGLTEDHWCSVESFVESLLQ